MTEDTAIGRLAEAVCDAHAELAGRRRRWTTLPAMARVEWRTAVDRALYAANESQLSPLSREPLPNPPDRERVFAEELARRAPVDSRHTRLSTRSAITRFARDLSDLWLPAIRLAVSRLEAGVDAAAALPPSAVPVLPSPEEIRA